MKKKVKKYFSSVGLKFPENEAELKVFNEIHDDYDHSLSENDIDPEKILRSVKAEGSGKQKKATNVDYHKRTVLAAEIVYQLIEDYTIGHLKVQKLMFLCQHTTNMSLHTNFLRQAMGPYDPRLMRSIDKQFLTRKWFQYNVEGYPKYVPLTNCGGHKEWYERYFSRQLDDIHTLIELFNGVKTKRVELIATLYACWNRAIQNNSIISNKLLIQEVYDWHESKKEKFNDEEIIEAIDWMKEKGIYPSK